MSEKVCNKVNISPEQRHALLSNAEQLVVQTSLDYDGLKCRVSVNIDGVDYVLAVAYGECWDERLSVWPG